MPIGIQDFEKLRNFGCVYVDKTEYVRQLVSEPAPYFLSRPRRFGKSLLLTTLKAYFQGKKALFDGLAISKLETEWTEYPVVHLDFNSGVYTSLEEFKDSMDILLFRLEEVWGVEEKEKTFQARFQGLIQRAYKKTGRQVVVLIDEYDKPLLESMGDEKLNAELRAVLKPFYGVLKSADAALRFVMLTGVTRFSKVSIFSDMNQLNEIGFSRDYAGICGITENELINYFTPELNVLAAENNESFEETLNKMRGSFNGYHFARDSESVYNPFSVLNTFNKREIQYYWFATGTPAFLFNELERTKFDGGQFNGGITISETKISDYQPGDTDPVPLLYQSGYLTITGFDKRKRRYNLGFPNDEVKYGFLENLLPRYAGGNMDKTSYYVGNMADTFEAGDLDGFLEQLKAFFSHIPYDLKYEKTESYYQTIFYIVFTLMGQYIETEVRNSAGRADAVVKTRDAVYVFEFKLDGTGSAEDALRQIEDKGYMLPYSAEGKRLVKAGVVFDTEKRTLGEWRVEAAG
jgi:hypothetical protein